MDYKILHTIPPMHATEAARIHFEAFEGKIGGLLGRDGRGAGFFSDIINPEFGLCAISNDGRKLLGVAGFKTSEGSLIDGNLDDIRRHYGWFGGLWRGLVLSVLERQLESDCLLMDGIAVSPSMRGRGIGSALLENVVDVARTLGKSRVRLDVIDSNPRARTLYERQGFVAGKVQSLGPLKHIFGFESATTMVRPTGV